ncbi:MAG: type II toxin-antitoxin system PemK/MazF family toxin [Neisseriaceae bacterium]|jgi:mRNA interferase MazF
MNKKRGEVWWVNLDPTLGAEIRKQRPCVILSHSSINEVRRTLVIVPLSSSPKPYPPIAINVRCQNKEVVAICDQIRAIDKVRFISYIEDMEIKDLEQIEKSVRKVLML